MCFYKKWHELKNNNEDYSEYVHKFLDSDEESLKVLLNGNTQDILCAVKMLLSIPIEEFIDAIDHEYSFSSGDIFQFSNFDDAVKKLSGLLAYEVNTLTFKEAGAKLIHAKNDVACIKYGENHAKTASNMSFVFINNSQTSRSCYVQNTALGTFSTTLFDGERMELIRRLALRNPFIKELIYKSKQGVVVYQEIASKVLSSATVIRRKHNNEIIVKYILKDNPLVNNFRW